MDKGDPSCDVSGGSTGPWALANALARLARGEVGVRLPRTTTRDDADRVAFLFNSVADELERLLKNEREQEARLASAVTRISDALARVAAGEFSTQLERDLQGDRLDTLVFLVNSLIAELSSFCREAERRSEETTQRLEREVATRTRELRESEDNFRRLFQAAPAPMILAGSKDGVIRALNDRALDELDLAELEHERHTTAALFAHDSERTAFFLRLEAEGRVSAFAAQLTSRKGRTFWALVDATMLSISGADTVLVSFTDLSEQKRIEEGLRELATTDLLTGTLSRARFFELAEDELARATRYHNPLCFAMLDVDHFKSVNDRFGHSFGDEALQIVGRTIRVQLRRQDQVGRYGGEEFSLVLPETTIIAARDVLDRVRGAVERIRWQPEAGPVKLTVSCGVAAFKKGDTVGTVLRRADEALYEAKRGGRNRVVALP